MPPKSNLLTRFSDDRGRVKEPYDEKFERHWVRKLRRAGVAPVLLSPAGSELPITDVSWVSKADSGAIRPDGAFSDGVIAMGCLMRGVTTDGKESVDRENLQAVVDVVDAMVFLADSLKYGEKVRKVIAALGEEVFNWRLRMYQAAGWDIPSEVQDALDEIADSSRADAKAELEEQWRSWGMPEEMISDAHGKHGHSKTPHGWICLDGSSRAPVSAPLASDAPLVLAELPEKDPSDVPVDGGLVTWCSPMSAGLTRVAASRFRELWSTADESTKAANAEEAAKIGLS